MSGRRKHVPPSWLDSRVTSRIPGAARLMARLTGDAVLEVRGRRSGRPRTTLARPILVGGATYLVAIRGDTDWSRNLRAAGEARIWRPDGWKSVRAIEVDGETRRSVVEAFLASSRFAETRRIMSEVLPAAEDHPTFRLDFLQVSR